MNDELQRLAALHRQQQMQHGPGTSGVPTNYLLNDLAAMWDAQTPLGKVALSTALIPGIGDVTGLAADVEMYAKEPESRNALNYGLTGLGLVPFIPGAAAMITHHGSPHLFSKFDHAKMGSGEGAQAYGWGTYLAENPDVAAGYQADLAAGYRGGDDLTEVNGIPATDFIKTLQPEEVAAYRGAISDFQDGWSRGFYHLPQPNEDFSFELLEHLRDIDGVDIFPDTGVDPVSSSARISLADKLSNITTKEGGYFYTVDLPDEKIAKMLDWDAPLSEQGLTVSDLADALYKDPQAQYAIKKWAQKNPDPIAGRALKELNFLFGDRPVSQALHRKGIPGIKYFDGNSRTAGQGTRNFVVFDENDMTILTRNGEEITR